MKAHVCAIGALAMLLGASVDAALPPTLDGSWYSPLQSGHGLTIERIDADSALLLWHVFDPAGKPLTLYIEADVTGNTMSGEAYAPQGMRFGSFAAGDLRMPRWGRVTLTFTDCRNARLDYDADDSAYGRGGMAITRLLPVSDSACDLGRPSDLSGLVGSKVDGMMDERSPSPSELHRPLTGFVDLDGKVRVVQVNPGGSPLTGGPAPYLRDEFAVVLGTPASSSGDPRQNFRVLANDWYCIHQQRRCPPLDAEGDAFTVDFTLRTDRFASTAVGVVAEANVLGIERPLLFRITDDRNDAPRSFRGQQVTFRQSDGSQSPPAQWRTLTLTSDSAGNLCLAEQNAPCLFKGRITREQGELFEFTLQPVDRAGPPYVGQARYALEFQEIFWGLYDLVLIGSNGRSGMAIVSDTHARH